MATRTNDTGTYYEFHEDHGTGVHCTSLNCFERVKELWEPGRSYYPTFKDYVVSRTIVERYHDEQAGW